MRDLRLIGVHDNGQHLLFSDADGKRYRVPLDESLRVAARRDRARLGQLQQEATGSMSAREVQGLIRRGLSAEEVAERSGWDLEKVHRFDAPVLAEREFMALKAGSCIVDAADEPPTTLAARATDRLRERGIDVDLARWDSRKEEGGPWIVTLEFPFDAGTQRATWSYAPRSASVAPMDDAARALTEVEIPGVIPGRHAAPGPIVDAPSAHSHAEVDEPIDLAAMRASARARRRSRPTATQPVDQGEDPDALVAPEHPGEAMGSGDAPGQPEAAPTEPTPPALARDEPQPESDQAAEQSAPSGRRGRRSVPSWDDIVFGTKGPDATE